MSSSEIPTLKPSAPPALKWLMRVTGSIALLLFLTPTFYVVKYYALDRPREEAMTLAQARRLSRTDPDALFFLQRHAQSGSAPGERTDAITLIGNTLRQPGIGWKRPLECLTAKATLAELAVKDPDPSVQAAASEELGKVAQGGAVIGR